MTSLTRFQEPWQFQTRHEQLAARRTANSEISALDELANAEVFDTKEIGGFLHQAGEPTWMTRI